MRASKDGHGRSACGHPSRESAAEAGETIERAVDRVYAGGIKPMEFGGSNGTADITRAVLAAL